MLRLTDIRFRYPGAAKEALAGVCAEFSTGKIHSLLGANGAGKTTLLSLLLGLLAPQQGRIEMNQARLAWCPQEYAFHETLTVRENLSFFGRVQGLGGRTLQQRIAMVCEITGLADALTQIVGRQPGGIKRRVNLAIALLAPCDWLLLDEATTGMDAVSRRHILDAIKTMPQHGISVLLTSHLLEEVAELATHITLLAEGVVAKSGALNELLHENHALTVVLAASPSAAQIREAGGIAPGLTCVGNELRWPLAPPVLAPLLAALENANLRVTALQKGHGRLENFYLQTLREAASREAASTATGRAA